MTSTTLPDRAPARPLSGLGAALHSETLKAGPVRVLVKWIVPMVLATGIGAAGAASIPEGLETQNHGPVDHGTFSFMLLGLLLFGLVWSMINAAGLHLSEVSNDQLLETYRCTPQRPVIVLVRAMLGAVVGFLGSLVAVQVGFLTFSSAVGGTVGAEISAARTGRLDVVLVLPVMVACMSAGAVAVAALVRKPVVAFGLLVSWMTFAEDLIQRSQALRAVFQPLLPWRNAMYASGVTDEVGFLGSRVGAGSCLIVETVLILVVACVVEWRRDVRTR